MRRNHPNNGLFNWCVSSYASEIHSYLKRKELKAKKLLFRSPQLSYRPQLIDWIRQASERHFLSNITVHLTVRLLDLFMDDHNIRENRLAAICMSCLLVAAKFEEEDSKIPKISELVSMMTDGTTIQDLQEYERTVMEGLHWDVNQVSAAHFAEYYYLAAVVKGDYDHFETPHRHLQDVVRSSLRDFLDLTLNEVYMNEYMSSKVAATCLLAARLEHGVMPVWPKALASFTGYSLSSLQPCLDLLTEAGSKDGARSKTKPSEDFRAESGYESASPDNAHKKRILSRS